MELKIKPKIVISLVATFLLLFLSITGVFAFAVSSFYYEGIDMYPGEIKDIHLVLQNRNGDQDINVKAIIEAGSEIVEITDPSDLYLVPFKVNKDVNMRITIPETAKPGDEYKIGLNFKTADLSAEGGLNLGMGIGKSINIRVVEKVLEEEKEMEVIGEELPEEKSGFEGLIVTFFILILGVLVIVILIWKGFSKKK